MTIDEYLAALKTRLVTDPVVAAFHISRERSTLYDGYLRARLMLNDGSQLEFAEYIQVSAGDQIAVVTYNYHWSDAEGRLIQRWDNTPHFPDLPGFPHHVHTASTEAPIPGQPIDLFSVLDEITSLLK